MIETLLGGLLGGVTRFAPEVLKFFDRKAERKHELFLLDKNLEVDKAKVSGEIAVANVGVQASQFTAAVDALKESVKGQSVQTVIKIIDAINALVRPGVTYILFGMWTTVKLVTLIHVIQMADSWSTLAQALPVWWGPDDQAMLAAVLNFWFLGRVFDKALKSS